MKEEGFTNLPVAPFKWYGNQVALCDNGSNNHGRISGLDRQYLGQRRGFDQIVTGTLKN